MPIDGHDTTTLRCYDSIAVFSAAKWVPLAAMTAVFGCMYGVQASAQSVAQPNSNVTAPAAITVLGHHIPIGATSPPGAIKEELTPRISTSVPAITSNIPVKPVGPLSDVAAAMARYGVKSDVVFMNFFDANPGAGIDRGNTQSNSALLLSATFDLSKSLQVPGASLHYLETLGMLRSNETWSSQIGDNTLGFQYPRIFKGNELSMLTYEQRLLSNRLDIEFGRSNPMRYFGLPVCQNALTCFDDVYAFDANVVPIIHASWLARVSYKLTNAWYLQAGGSEENPLVPHTNGYDWNGTGATGELALGEIGYRTDFDTHKYPQRYELIGYYNSSAHQDPLYTTSGRSKVDFPKEQVLVEHGTGGIMATGQKLIWRADGGRVKTLQPLSIAAYGGFGYSPDNTVAVKADVYGGLTLQSPFASRPFDRYGIEVHWSRLTDREHQFLQDAFSHAGGQGGVAGPDKTIFEVNGNVKVLPYTFIQPSVQYVINPNTYYAPSTRTLPRDGIVVSATLICFLGQAMGLSTPNF